MAQVAACLQHYKAKKYFAHHVKTLLCIDDLFWLNRLSLLLSLVLGESCIANSDLKLVIRRMKVYLFLEIEKWHWRVTLWERQPLGGLKTCLIITKFFLLWHLSLGKVLLIKVNIYFPLRLPFLLTGFKSIGLLFHNQRKTVLVQTFKWITAITTDVLRGGCWERDVTVSLLWNQAGQSLVGELIGEERRGEC